MRVNCPNCAAGYEVPDPLLKAGARTLRCARCGTKFQAGPAEVELAPPMVAETPIDSPLELEAAPAVAFPRAPPPPVDGRVVFHAPMVGPPRGRRATSGPLLGAAGWAVTLVVLAGAALGAVRERERIVAAWPAAARAYSAVGLSPAAVAAPAPPSQPPPAQPPARATAGAPAAGPPTAGP